MRLLCTCASHLCTRRCGRRRAPLPTHRAPHGRAHSPVKPQHPRPPRRYQGAALHARGAQLLHIPHQLPHRAAAAQARRRSSLCGRHGARAQAAARHPPGAVRRGHRRVGHRRRARAAGGELRSCHVRAAAPARAATQQAARRPLARSRAAAAAGPHHPQPLGPGPGAAPPGRALTRLPSPPLLAPPAPASARRRRSTRCTSGQRAS